MLLQEATKFSCRISQAITIPSDDTFRRRRGRGTWIRVDATDEEEDEDEERRDEETEETPANWGKRRSRPRRPPRKMSGEEGLGKDWCWFCWLQFRTEDVG